MTAQRSPYEVLGLAPTLDLALIKRGWFTALKLHPPHADPEGFRLLREAYEALSDPVQRTKWYARSGFDARAELAAYDDLERAPRPAPVSGPSPARALRVAQFAKTLASAPWREACDLERRLRRAE